MTDFAYANITFIRLDCRTCYLNSITVFLFNNFECLFQNNLCLFSMNLLWFIHKIWITEEGFILV
jgi:hypothetical protein